VSNTYKQANATKKKQKNCKHRLIRCIFVSMFLCRDFPYSFVSGLLRCAVV